MAKSSARVLVTGATGFVGSHLVEALTAGGFAVRALVRATSDVRRLRELGVEQVVGSLEDPASLARAVNGADTVLHLAALVRARGPAEFARANASGTEAVVRASAEAGVGRLVYLSSLAAVGPVREGRAVEASDEPRPLTAYGRTKLAGERAVLGERRLHGVVLRAPAVYGPGDRELFTFFRLAARGVFPLPGGPERSVQLIHVRDLARALVLAGSAREAEGVYHVADPTAYGWPALARAIGVAVGREVRIVRLPPRLVTAAAAGSELAAALVRRATIFDRDKARELLAPGWLCETGAARRELGFETEIPLAEGLGETAAWYRARGWL